MSVFPCRKSGWPKFFNIFSFSSEFLLELRRMEHLLKLFTCVMVSDEDFVSGVGVKERLDDVPEKFDGK